MKLSLGKKITLLLVVFALALSGVALAIGYNVVDNMNNRHFMQKADETSATVARVVDVQSAAALRQSTEEIYKSIKNKVGSEEWGSPEFEAYVGQYAQLAQTPEYQELLGELRNLQEVNNVSCLYLAYVDPVDEAFVYLVDAAEDEPCPIGTIDPIFDINRPVLSNPAVGFPAYITNTSEYGWLVTSGTPIYDSNGTVVCYALADISMDAIKQEEQQYLTLLTLYLLGIIALLVVLTVLFVRRFVTGPINKLSEAAKRYCDPKEEQRSTFKNLNIRTGDEIESLYNSMVQMEHDVDTYIDNLVETREKLDYTRMEADYMSDLARTDALTGIRNKLAYDQEATILQRELDEGKTEFGIAIVDLNDLKKTNDLYGHDCGDVSLRQLSMITCTTFEHSPVFRIGGDEFAIILRGEDYQHIEELVETFVKRIRALQETDPSKLKPWERISAAIGYAIFDAKLDANVSAVFRRADEHMYENKKQMKGSAPR